MCGVYIYVLVYIVYLYGLKKGYFIFLSNVYVGFID